MVEKFADYWNAANVHIDRVVFRPIVEFDRAARQPQVGQPRPDRAGAGDRPQGDQGRSQAEARDPDRDRLPGPHAQSRPTARPARTARSARSPRVRQALEAAIDRKALNQVVFNGEVAARQPVGQPEEPLLPGEVPGPEARRRQGQEAAAGGRRERRRSRSTSWCRTTPRARQVAEVIQAMAGGSRLRHEDPRHRVRDLAEGGRAGPLPGLLHRLVGPRRSRRQQLHLPQVQGAAEQRPLLRPGGRPAARRRAQGRASWRIARRSTRRSPTST